MKLHSLSMLCLSLLLLNTPFSLTRGRGGRGKSSGSKKVSSGTNTGYKPKKDSTPQGGHPKQNNQGSPGQHGNYPRQPGAAGNPNQYPGQSSPYGGYGGGYGGYGRYGGGYGGYGRYGGGYGGNRPSEKSKGFARSAVVAAAGGAVAGTALGYGLGQFSRPHFNVRSPEEEYYYKHYMHRNHGSDKGGHAVITQPVQSYEDYMDACMKRSDILPVKTQKPQIKPGATATATTKTNTSTPVTSESNDTATENPSTPTPASPGPPNQPEEDDTVSIVEIGYPALIEQVKTRRCLELYMAYSMKYMRQEGPKDGSTGGVEGLEMGFQRLLAVVTSAILMLLNSNVPVLLH
uniref:Prion protein, related sequence 3 n=1 Tax=Neolamprologus brichardi TaxID=32507 RepID=A0A3Q4I1T4_NEOBR